MQSYDQISRKSEFVFNRLKMNINEANSGSETYRTFLKKSIHPISRGYAEKILEFNKQSKQMYEDEKAKGISKEYLKDKILQQASELFIEYRNDILAENERAKVLQKKAIEVYNNRRSNDTDPIKFRRKELEIRSLSDAELENKSQMIHFQDSPNEDEYMLIKSELLQRDKDLEVFNELSTKQGTTMFWRSIPEGKEAFLINKFYENFSGNDMFYVQETDGKINNFPFEEIFDFGYMDDK